LKGRDGAGKGEPSKRLQSAREPAGARGVVALPALGPSVAAIHPALYGAFSSGREIIIFDRSWYNRAGVEYVMGFCTKAEHRNFLELCPRVEKVVVDQGIQLIKYWLEVSNAEQKRRFEARIEDPLRQWKLSPTDLPSRSRWYDYSHARDMMLKATDTKVAPRYILRSDDKKRARPQLYLAPPEPHSLQEGEAEKVKMLKRKNRGKYDDQATLKGRNFVPEKYWNFLCPCRVRCRGSPCWGERNGGGIKNG
jgi:polyphosphate kinase 2 (PPK2 family)